MGLNHVMWALHKVRGLDAAAKLVLISLGSFADENGECWPSAAAIADVTGLSTSTVRHRLAKLAAMGALTRRQRFSAQGHLRSNIYALAIGWHGPAGKSVTTDVATEVPR